MITWATDPSDLPDDFDNDLDPTVARLQWDFTIGLLLDFLRRQVLTSRNVRGGWLVDTLLGGLNYQIEHHLFPSMPRPNLRRSQALIRAFCDQHGVSYWETTLLRSYAQALHHLHAVGQPLRTTPG